LLWIDPAYGAPRSGEIVIARSAATTIGLL
jgi:hypothetical protein